MKIGGINYAGLAGVRNAEVAQTQRAQRLQDQPGRRRRLRQRAIRLQRNESARQADETIRAVPPPRGGRIRAETPGIRQTRQLARRKAFQNARLRRRGQARRRRERVNQKA